MKTEHLTPAEAAERIRAGDIMVIAGADNALAGLPTGNWIGGSSHYFLTGQGGRRDDVNLMCTTIEAASGCRIRHLATDDLPALIEGRYENGFSVMLIPGFSTAHTAFALHGPGLPGLFDQPLMGWISGVPLEDIGTRAPKIVDGKTGRIHEDGAVIVHLALPEGLVPRIDILNLFTPDTDPALRFTFPETGFSARTALVNGQEVGLARYLIDRGIGAARPLVADYAGALVNVSFESLDPDTGEVHFYAPVMAGVEYRLAQPLDDYASDFRARAHGDGRNRLSCNCILNYLHGGLEGQRTGSYTGPATFGEIAYMLLNQTMVHMALEDSRQQDDDITA